MADIGGQERTEQATPKKREESRRKGQVARSTEVNSAVMLLTGFTALLVFSGYILTRLQSVITGTFTSLLFSTLTVSTAAPVLTGVISTFFTIMLPVFIVMAVAGILVNVLQIGILFTSEPLVPKFEKINPTEGLKRIFSRRTLETFARDIIKIVVVGWIGYTAVKGILVDMMTVADSSVGNIFAFTGSMVFTVAMKILMGYIIIAVLDYAFQRWDHERNIMMTKQEIREEMKQAEGDPLLKQRIRSLQREISRRRMMEEVPKAEVVITNPTHYAVALAYESGMNAPLVVAKGRNLIAQRIRDRAKEAGVPVVENVDLARALYRAVDIGQQIPGELYTAVAEVLAYVYKLKGKNVVQ